MKTAFLFPGQGAQKCGMAETFYKSDADAAAVFKKAGKILGFDIEEIVFKPDKRLDITSFTQPAMVCAGIAMLEVIKKRGLNAQVCAGLSLGEYEALYYSGVISMEDALRTVGLRGKLMQDAMPDGTGAMSAVLGLDAAQVQKAIDDIENVWIANYNCPGQIVITGLKDAVNKAHEALKTSGARRMLPLNVSGAFHCPLLDNAAEKLYEFLGDVELSKPEIPYVANYTGEYVYEADDIRKLLRDQVSGSVRFEQSIKNMISQGIDTFIEIGPGKTLSGFVKKISTDVSVCNIETVEDLDVICNKIC